MDIEKLMLQKFFIIQNPLKKELIDNIDFKPYSINTLSENKVLNVKTEFFILFVIFLSLLVIPNFFSRKKIIIEKEKTPQEEIMENPEARLKLIQRSEQERIDEKIKRFLDGHNLSEAEREFLRYLFYMFGCVFLIIIFCFLSKLQILEFLLKFDLLNQIFKKFKIQKNARNFKRFIRKVIFKFKQFVTFHIFKKFKHHNPKDYDV